MIAEDCGRTSPNIDLLNSKYLSIMQLDAAFNKKSALMEE